MSTLLSLPLPPFSLVFHLISNPPRPLQHGLHEVTNPKLLGGTLNLGGRNGLQVAHTLKAKYWIGTHDEVKKASGFVSKVLKRRIWTVEEALREEELVQEAAEFRHLKTGEEVALG